MSQPKWNHYVCEECGATTIAFHENEGVTPFLIRCHAKDRKHPTGFIEPGCRGSAQSTFFSGPQDDNQKPHIVFYRPSAIDAIAAINKEPQRVRQWYLDHYEQGGSLMKLPDTLPEPTK